MSKMIEKICLVAIAKHEKDYIIDWVDYYIHTIKVDKIIVVDNNDDGDNENLTKILDKYIKEKTVQVVTKYRNKRANQRYTYEEIYKNNAKDYDWFCFFDIDEYLVMNNGMSLHGWLETVNKNIDVIHVNWKNFGDNDLVEYEKIPVMQRFTRPYVEDKTSEQNPEYFVQPESFYQTHTYYYLRDNYQVKSIVRGKNNLNRYVRNKIHKFNFENGKYVDSDLTATTYFDKPNTFSIDHITYKNCQLNHYITKTIKEYMERRLSRTLKNGCQYSDIDELRRNFIRFNKWTKEKEKIFNEFVKKVKTK